VRSSVLPEGAPGSKRALATYRLLEGPEGSYRYLLTARDGRTLDRILLEGARLRLGREVKSLNELGDDYYRVGPVEQYLMQSGRVYFRDMVYDELHRMQIDLETTSLSPERGRIFLVAIHDSKGLAITLEAPRPDDERQLILYLCQLVRERDPDVLENHGLFSFDLPFLEARAAALGVPLALGRKGGKVLLERFEEVLAVGPEARRRTRYSVAGRELIDTLDAVRRFDFSSRELPSTGSRMSPGTSVSQLPIASTWRAARSTRPTAPIPSACVATRSMM
jgi:DNA polymerase I